MMATIPREPHKKGDRVKLVFTDDQYTKLKPGDRGTVRSCDWLDFSKEWQVWIKWDSGSNLAMVIPHDSISRVGDEVTCKICHTIVFKVEDYEALAKHETTCGSDAFN